MRISLRRRIGRYKLSFVFGTITPVWGVNSNLKEGGHIIMWEFDDPSLMAAIRALRYSQSQFSLPAIHISQSSEGGGYHAYCLARKEWLESIVIVASTGGVDASYVSMCAMRGHWTLRLTDKGMGEPVYACTLDSAWAESVEPSELTSWVNYEVWSAKQILTVGERGL